MTGPLDLHTGTFGKAFSDLQYMTCVCTNKRRRRVRRKQDCENPAVLEVRGFSVRLTEVKQQCVLASVATGGPIHNQNLVLVPFLCQSRSVSWHWGNPFLKHLALMAAMC